MTGQQRESLQGLYVITPEHTGARDLTAMTEAALRGGARIVQYRDKSGDHGLRRDTARALLAVCRDHRVPLLINDDVELALATGADGVHLGRDDTGLAAARARLGTERIIGMSCYNDFALAQTAAAGGADYVAFGSFFASPTKPHAVSATPALLSRARRELAVPAVAIGGISPENGAALVAAGARMLAVISTVFGADDITAAARAFAPCFDPAEENMS